MSSFHVSPPFRLVLFLSCYLKNLSAFQDRNYRLKCLPLYNYTSFLYDNGHLIVKGYALKNSCNFSTGNFLGEFAVGTVYYATLKFKDLSMCFVLMIPIKMHNFNTTSLNQQVVLFDPLLFFRNDCF